MANPTIYERSYGFSNYQATSPQKPLPGNKVDGELDNIELTTSQTIAALADIRRSDGKLNNGIVTYEALAAGIFTGVQPAVEWETATSYGVGATVFYDVAFYRCLVEHVSGVFATDLDDGKWTLFADLAPIVTEAGEARDEAVAAAATATTAAGTATTAAGTATTAASTATTAAGTATTAAGTATTAAGTATTAAGTATTAAGTATTAAGTATTKAAEAAASAALIGSAILYSVQSLTGPQQTQALTNLGATPAGIALLQAASLAAQQALLGAVGRGLKPFGLVLSNNVTDATNDIDVSAGEVPSDSASPVMIKLPSAMTKRLDAAWAVGTGNGGLDTGSIGNNTYHLWLIYRPDTGVVDWLYSLSATAPTIPNVAYTEKAYLWPIIRSGGTILPFVHDIDSFQHTGPTLPIDVTNPGTSAATRTLTGIPTGIRVEAHVSYFFTNTTASDTLWLSDLAIPDLAPSNSAAPLGDNATGDNVQVGMGTKRVLTNTSAQIRSRMRSGAATTNLRISTLGYRVLRR